MLWGPESDVTHVTGTKSCVTHMLWGAEDYVTHVMEITWL